MTLLSVGAATLVGGHAQWIELRPAQDWPGWRPDHDHAILLRHTIDD
jgi:hypothetical protein